MLAEKNVKKRAFKFKLKLNTLFLFLRQIYLQTFEKKYIKLKKIMSMRNKIKQIYEIIVEKRIWIKKRLPNINSNPTRSNESH